MNYSHDPTPHPLLNPSCVLVDANNISNHFKIYYMSIEDIKDKLVAIHCDREAVFNALLAEINLPFGDDDTTYYPDVCMAITNNHIVLNSLSNFKVSTDGWRIIDGQLLLLDSAFLTSNS